MQDNIQYLKNKNPQLRISEISLPENHSLNTMWLNYGLDGILSLLEERVIITNPDLFRTEISELNLIHEGKMSFKTSLGTYYILGQLPSDLGIMKVSIHFEETTSKRKHRNKIDLYDRAHVLNFSKAISEGEHLEQNDIEADLLKLTDLLEIHRDDQLELNQSTKRKSVNLLPPEKEREAIIFLSQPDLINRIDGLIQTSGIVGEESNRKMVFVIASTYKMLQPLHGLIQGTSGSGKTHLINAIASLMPSEDILNMTRVTSKSFYHYQKDELVNKLVLIQDIDGLDEEAQYAFREMQSAGQVSSSTTYKDKFGNLLSTVKTVQASFASLVATTHAEIYYDNMSRSIVLGIDESEEQTHLIIVQQNKKIAGLIDGVAEVKARELLQNCIRTLKTYEVVNRYADKLLLPVEAKMLRRLNNHYQSFVCQITLLNQFQREQDEQGRLIATIEDLEQACEILFDAIMWKIDELDSSTRQFFEQLKNYVKKQSQGIQYKFSAREVRQEFNLSKSQMFRYMDEMKQLEYIHVAEGSANKGFKYKIAYWDDMDKTRQRIKNELMNQIRGLK
ncbi:MAG: hypothetical protein M3Q58_04235 [Bacteroidota bacterium]|nr:hypothetical protein [Bacteroidota bacterium]